MGSEERKSRGKQGLRARSKAPRYPSRSLPLNRAVSPLAS
jgi:hypothetical protein